MFVDSWKVLAGIERAQLRRLRNLRDWPVHALLLRSAWADECVRCHTRKMPRSYSPLRGKTGAPWFNLWLLWSEVLVIAQAYDVLEHRRSGRQVRRVLELRIEEV